MSEATSGLFGKCSETSVPNYGLPYREPWITGMHMAHVYMYCLFVFRRYQLFYALRFQHHVKYCAKTCSQACSLVIDFPINMINAQMNLVLWANLLMFNLE